MPAKQSLHDRNTQPHLETGFQIVPQRLSAGYETHQSLLSGFSHDLRGPLSVIVGFVEVLDWGVAGELNEKQRELIDYIRREALSLHAVADRIQYHASGG
jgi:signal transduction histidine kinase